MAILTKDQILKSEDLPRETVNVPEWGGEVIVKALTGLERYEMVDRYTDALRSNPKENFEIYLAAATMVDERGEPLFQTLEEVRLLGRRNGAALNRVFQAARRMNGYDREAQKKG